MHTELPRRPYVELPPPPDGLGTARREASRRRTRRALVAVGGAVTAGVVGALVVLVGGGKDLAVLRPAPVAPAIQPTPSAVPVPTPPPVAPHSAATAHPLRSSVAGGPSSAGGSAPSQQHGGGSTSQQSPSGQVTVTRTSGRNPEGPRVCRTGASGENAGVQPGDNWCTSAAAVAATGGERLSYTLCRDSTTGGTLHFAGSREVELRVVRNGAVVWRYSAHAAQTSTPHTLTAAADDCWTWSLVWPGRTDAGGVAPEARYTLQAISTADEFAGGQETAVTFDY